MPTDSGPEGARRRGAPSGGLFERASDRLPAAALAALLLSIAAAPVAGPGLVEAEVQCEEAKAHLKECCRHFESGLQCEYKAGCDATTPDLDVAESKRIRRLDCGEIVRDGLCNLSFEHADLRRALRPEMTTLRRPSAAPFIGASRRLPRLACVCTAAYYALVATTARAEPTSLNEGPEDGPPNATNASEGPKEAPPTGAANASQPPQRHGTFSGVLNVAPTYQWLFGIPIRAADLGVGLAGADWAGKKVHAYFAANLLLGETEAGLSVTRASFGARLERRFDAVHVGLTAGLGHLWLGRAGGPLMPNLTGSARLFAGRDFELSDSQALTVDATFSADYLPGHDPTFLFGPGVALGLRVR